LGVGRGALLVRQTPGTLAQVHALVAALRRERRGLIELEAGFYRTSPALADALSGPASAEALARLDDAVARAEASLLAGGFVVARAGEKVSVLAGRERAFVAGWTPLAKVSASAPTIALAGTGFRLAGRVRSERGG